jgi:phage gp16-like protein
MSAQQSFDRHRYYRLLKVGQRELGWDDEFYYGIWLPMQGAAKKNGRYSATTLSNSQLFSAVEAMKAKGFRVRKKPSHRPLADDAQSQKIRALWLTLHQAGVVKNPSEKSLAAYVKRQTGVAALQWLTVAQASRVIEALKKWRKRTQ